MEDRNGGTADQGSRLGRPVILEIDSDDCINSTEHGDNENDEETPG